MACCRRNTGMSPSVVQRIHQKLREVSTIFPGVTMTAILAPDGQIIVKVQSVASKRFIFCVDFMIELARFTGSSRCRQVQQRDGDGCHPQALVVTVRRDVGTTGEPGYPRHWIAYRVFLLRRRTKRAGIFQLHGLNCSRAIRYSRGTMLCFWILICIVICTLHNSYHSAFLG